MKINRLLIAFLLGFSLLTTSALASDNSNNSSQSHWSFLSWIYNPVADSHRQADQYGQDSGRGNNCDHGRGNGGGYCGTGNGNTGGSTGSGSSGSTGSGSSTPPTCGKGTCSS
jgi:hypothetical protein